MPIACHHFDSRPNGAFMLVKEGKCVRATEHSPEPLSSRPSPNAKPRAIFKHDEDPLVAAKAAVSTERLPRRAGSQSLAIGPALQGDYSAGVARLTVGSAPALDRPPV
jgi:hypothetical protein